MQEHRERYRLVWRVVVANAALVALLLTALLVTPAMVHGSPVVAEAVEIAAGLVGFVLVNILVMQRALAPLEELARQMQVVDMLRPGHRLSVPERRDEVGVVVRRFNEMLERLETERRLSSRRLVDAHEGERRAIARDLHDEVGQQLTSVLLQLRTAQLAGADVSHAQDATRQALDDVRRISRELRPELLADLGLGSALRELTSTMSRTADIRVDVDMSDDVIGKVDDDDVELAVYRIVQEALTNVVRHADATRVQVTIRSTAPSRLQVVVSDDGCGVGDPSRSDSIGLRSMRERAILVGAQLDITSNEPTGTRVLLTVPLTSAGD